MYALRKNFLYITNAYHERHHHFGGRVLAEIVSVQGGMAELVAEADAGEVEVPQNERPFRADRATVHLFRGPEDGEEDDDDDDSDYKEESGDDESEEERPRKKAKKNTHAGGISDEDFATLKPHLRRGDLLEDVNQSGYRSEGLYIYNGKTVEHLDDTLDDYGCIGPKYLIYKEFNPHYWHTETMNVNNILVPDVDHASAGWHGGEYPCAYVYAPAVKAADGLKVTFEGVEYEISQELKDWFAGDHDGEDSAEEAPYVSDITDYIITGIVY